MPNNIIPDSDNIVKLNTTKPHYTDILNNIFSHNFTLNNHSSNLHLIFIYNLMLQNYEVLLNN